jgi:hypothetical protein
MGLLDKEIILVGCFFELKVLIEHLCCSASFARSFLLFDYRFVQNELH